MTFFFFKNRVEGDPDWFREKKQCGNFLPPTRTISSKYIVSAWAIVLLVRRRVEKGLIITGLFPRVKLPRCKINRRGLRRRWKLRENAAPAKEASVQGLGTISSLIDRLSCHWRGGIVIFFPPPQVYQRSLPPPPYRAVKTAVRIVPLLLALVFLEPQPWISTLRGHHRYTISRWYI